MAKAENSKSIDVRRQKDGTLIIKGAEGKMTPSSNGREATFELTATEDRFQKNVKDSNGKVNKIYNFMHEETYDIIMNAGGKNEKSHRPAYWQGRSGDVFSFKTTS